MRAIGSLLRLPSVACALICVIVVWAIVPDPVRLPVSGSLESLVWPLAPVIVVCVWGVGASTCLSNDLRRAPRGVWLRALHLLVLVESGVVLGVIGDRWFDGFVVTRNVMLFGGVAALGHVAAGNHAWPIVPTIAVAGWLFAAQPEGEPVPRWVLPMATSHDRIAAAASALVALAGSVAFLAGRTTGRVLVGRSGA